MTLLLAIASGILALLAAAHRDERGQFGFFKDLFSDIGSGVGAIRDFIVDLGNKLWAVIANGAAAVRNQLRDLGHELWGVITLATTSLLGVLDAAANKLWGVIAGAGARVFDGIADLGLKLWGALSTAVTVMVGVLDTAVNKIWGVIANGAAAIRDGIGLAANKLWEVLANGFSGVIGSVEQVARSADDVAGAAKDLPGEVGKELRDVFERVVGFGGGFIDDWVDLAERYLRGEIDSIEQLLGMAHERRPESSILDNTVYFFSFLTFFMVAIQEVAGVRAEPIVQRFRMEHPTALLDPEDIRDAILRGVGNPDALREHLRKAGYDDFAINIIESLYFDLPPVSDLIRMAVREVFSPEVAERFGQFEDFPSDFAFNARQQGISEEWARAYWAAHWDLPSAQQMFEMLHRGIIDRETLQVGLRALDVMPFWRDKLTEIAFNTVTRVDTRRLFQAGVWDRARVEREYLNLGYRPEDAAALTEWTVQEYGDSTVGARDLTRAAIEKSYKQGRITADEAIARLVDLGYDDDEADFFIANVTVDLEDERAREAEASVRDITQSTVLTAYREGVMPRADAEALLADLGYTAEGVELLLAVQDFRNENELVKLRLNVIEREFARGEVSADQAEVSMLAAGVGVERAALLRRQWELKYAEKSRELTEAQLGRALEAGIIDDVTYLQRVIAMGYTDADAAVLLQLRVGRDETASRQLSLATVRNLYRRELLTRNDAAARLAALGLTAEDAELELRLVDQLIERDAEAKRDAEERAAAAAVRELSRSTIEGAYKRGNLTRAAALDRLISLGYRPDDAELALQNVDADLAKAASS